MHEILKEKGINSQNHVFPGNHSAEYIQSNIEKYLKFYGSKGEYIWIWILKL
ncbi:hypothetical protein [Clostridium estertheticum]|uniref:hypothetical protein n=1 Tax=Clostridium estertheticum TaxID=238834 RepID=UPI001C0AE994|nr:hypothetical protein [Clostridium estertheticum]MBU3187785.1 hypothetical protein [Clostridium estertheticum]